MRRDATNNLFALEELEPRVLLSANLATVGATASAFAAGHHSSAAHEIPLQPGLGHSSQNHQAYNPAGQVEDMFAGVEQPQNLEHSAQVETQTVTSTSAGQESQESAVAQSSTATSTATTTAVHERVISTVVSGKSVAISSPVTSDAPSQISQLTKELKTANGPPTTASTATDSTASVLQSADNQSVSTISSSSTLAGSVSSTSSFSATLSVSSTAKPLLTASADSITPSALPGLQDLKQYISDLLASQNHSFTSTENLGSASLGDFLQLDGLTLVVTATLSNGTWSGSVSISATSATLFPGKSFGATIISNTSDPAITGSYTIGAGFALTIPQTATMVMKIGEALTVTASGVSLTYNPSGTATQVLATVSNATVTSGQFSGMLSATLSNFVIRRDGFSFDAFNLNSADGATPGIGNIISATNATLTVSAFNVTFGDGTSDASMSGSVSLTLAGMKVFPDGNFVQFHADSVTGSYSFSNFDGTGLTGQLTVIISGFKLSMGEAFDLTTTGDVVLTPGQNVMATLSSATLSSPQFAGLGTLQLANVEIRRDGFMLGSVEWNSNGPVSIGDIISADNVTVTLSDFGVQYGSAPTVSGGIAVSAENVVLFPNVSLLNLHLGTLAGNYQIHSPAVLSLHLPAFDIPIGDALTIHLGEVDIAPGQQTMLHVEDTTVTANMFSGLLEFSLGNFDLTRSGFSLGSFDITLNTKVTIDSFISFSNVGLHVTDFVLDKSSTPVVSGTISLTLGSMTLFPGSSLVTSTFTNLSGSYDLASATTPGRLTLSADTFTLSIGGQLSLEATGIVITPASQTLLTIATAKLTFAPLNGLEMNVTGLEIRQDGFSIATASATLSDITLGGLLALQAPTITLTNIDYTFGAGLTGSVGFSTTSAVLSLDSALTTSASGLSGSYNLATGALTVTLDSFGLNVAGFADLTAATAVITYSPADDNTSKVLVAVTGLNVFLGSEGVGVSVVDGTLSLAVFKSGTGTTTYALEASGAVSLDGLPSDTLTLSGNIKFRKNTAGTVAEEIVIDDNTSVHLNFASNETSIFAQNLTLNVGSVLALTGDFGFSQYVNGGITYLALGATNLDATMAAGPVSVTVTGASLGLLVKPAQQGGEASYALVTSSGTASLNGVPAVTLNATGLTVRVRHGFDASALSALPAVQTPGGDVNLDFSGMGAGTSDVTDIEGHITLGVSGFVSVEGDFGFQKFTSGTTTCLAVGAKNVTVTLGTATTNVTVEQGAFGLIVKPGANGDPATYALIAQGNVSLNGVPNLILDASNVLVRVRHGLDVSADVADIPNSVQTSAGAVTLDFAGLGTGTDEVASIEGHLIASVTGFGSLEGDFGFQSFVNGQTGDREISVGAKNVSVTLGTATTNLTVSGATLGLIIRPGVNGAPSTYALQATATSASLNGITGLTVNATNLLVRIRKGLDVSTTNGAGSVHTSDGDVTLDFSGLGAGSSDVSDVQGSLTVVVGTFVSLKGDFGFQSYTIGTGHYIAVGATNLTVTLAAGSVEFGLANASVGILIKQGTPSTYILQAKGSSDPNDTSFTGVSGLTVSATNLLVRARSGLDPATLPAELPASIQTPGGPITFDFTGLSGSSSQVTDIQGHLTLAISGFTSLEGDFGIQKFSDASGSAIAIGAKNIDLVLGTATTNVSLTGATLGLVVRPGVGYALMTSGGACALNGVPDLSVSATGLSVRVLSGLDPTSVNNLPAIQTSGGPVTLDFTGLSGSNVMEISGTVAVNVANFVSLSGTFSFTKSVSGNITKILVGATGVEAFIGSSDQQIGVKISNADLGLVILRDSTAGTSTYALQTSAVGIQVIGLPSGTTLSGNVSVAINTTGTAINEPGVNVSFANGTNVKSFGGHLSLSVGSAFNLGGDFSFTKVVNGSLTKIMIGAANMTANSPVLADGGSDTFNLSNGTIGMVLFRDGTTNLGYAMTASATATLAVGGGSVSATATLTIRRNTTTSGQTETVKVGNTNIPISFTNAEVASGGIAFQKIALSNIGFDLGGAFLLTVSQGSTSNPAAGASSTTVAGVTLSLINPNTQDVLFTINADSGVYTSFTGTVTGGSNGITVRSDGLAWQNGDKDLVITNVSFTIGSFVSFSAASVDVQHYTTATGEVNAFKFVGATVTFLSDGKPMVSLTGSPQFHFSDADGFKLDSFTNPGFAFLGQSLGASPAVSPSITGATPAVDTSHTLGPITLSDPGVSLTGFQFKFAGGTTVQLSAVVHLTVGQASLSAGPVAATLKNIDGSFTVGVSFDIANLGQAPTISANGFNLSVGSMEIKFSDYITFSATNFTINPAAAATEKLVRFDTLSATLHAGPLNVTGTVTKFAILGDGSFFAETGFGVSISLGANDASQMSWPAWLPLQSASVTIFWANFNAHPDQFLVRVSAEVHTTFGAIAVDGSIVNVVIDPQLIEQGKLPIIAADGIGLSVTGNLFGGTVSGSFVGGVVRFDTAGHIVDSLGNIQGTTTPATGEITNVFYAGLQGSVDLGGAFSFNIRIGFSEFGPLQLYVELGAQIPLGNTGLFITALRGGVIFGKSFPTITITGQPSDALQLRNSGFTTPDNLTLAQWQAQLRSQVVTMYRDPNSTHDGFGNLANTPILIQAGVTIAAANDNVFRVDADMFFDTSGKILVLGTATFGNSLSIGVKMYTDLHPLFTGGSSLSILFLMEMPAQPNDLGIKPIYSLYGVVTFSYINSVFKITIAGAADLDVLGGLKAHAEATLTLTFSSNSFTVELSDATFSIPQIQDTPLGTAAGKITIEKVGDSFNIWGGFTLNANLTGLQNAGIYAQAGMFIKLNTTSEAKQVVLQTTQTSTVTLDLKAQSFSLFISGYADFKIAGQQVFRLDGALTLDINPNSITIFVAASLKMGPNASSPILVFNANGLVYVQMQEANGIHVGFAAKLTLTLGVSLPNLTFGMNWLLVVNTTGSEITYLIPSPVAGGPTIATVMGPDYSSSNPLALTSYETTSGTGQRQLVIPSGPPAESLTNYSTWTASPANTAYFIIIGRGSLNIGNSFVITGAINIRASLGNSGFNFTLETNATLALKANGNTVFSFQVSGGIQISNAGIVAALNVNFSTGFSIPSSLGFSLSATFTLKLNTTGVATTIAGIQVSAGTNKFFAQIHARGHLKFLGNVVDMHGSFDITATGTSLTIEINATVTLLSFATFTVNGFAGIYYDSHPGFALRVQLGLGGADGIAPVSALGSSFVIKGTFTLELNTCSVTRYTSNNTPIVSGFKIAVTNLNVYLFGFNLTGSITISITSAGVSIDIPYLRLDLFGIVTITLSGAYHPDGSFYFFGSASFQIGNHTFGIGGSISVGIYHNWKVKFFGQTITLNGFTASVSGWVAAFGVEISASGSISIMNGSVDIYITIHVVVDLGTAHFHLGSTSPPPSVSQSFPPAEPEPTPPPLGAVVSGALVLYIGSDAHLRINNLGTVTGAQPTESYTLTLLSAGTITGQKIRIVALGYTQDFDNVTSIVVHDTQTGNDIINIGSSITVPVTVNLGSGISTVFTGSGAATVTVTGNGGNQITTGNNANVTISGNGNNYVTTGSNSTLTVSGNGANQVNAIGGSASVTISGTGNNGVSFSDNYSGTITITNTATGINAISVTNGSPAINVNGGGNNLIAVNSGSTRTITITGSGANIITSIGAGTTNLAISGNGANSVIVGAGLSTITVTGNGNNSIGTGAGAATVNLRGSGNNSVVTSTGFTTVNDQGSGSNVIIGGPGGGVYFGGLDSNGQPFTGKAISSLSTSHGNFSMNVSGYSAYTLSDSALNYGAFQLNLSGVKSAVLNAISNNAAHQFVLNGWSGSATLNGAGADNTFAFTPMASAANLNETLTNTSLLVSGGLSQTINLSNIQTANLVGAATGANTFTVSGWTGAGSLQGPIGTGNTVVATNDVDFVLSNGALSRSGIGSLALINIQNAILTGGTAANVFTVLNWSGNAFLNGAGGSDIYNLTLSGSGTGIFTVADSGPAPGDTLNIANARNTFVNSNQVKVGTQTVTYSGIALLNITGSIGGLTYNVQSTNVGVATTVTATGSDNTFNIGSTAGLIPSQPGELKLILGSLTLTGSGTDAMNVDDSGNAGGRTGILTSSSLTFTGVAPIVYSGMNAMTISLGQGADSFTVIDTITNASAQPSVVINGNGGNDSFSVLDAHAVTAINGGDANDTFSVFGNTSVLNLNGDAGDDTFNVFASVLNGGYRLNGSITLDGGTGVAALNLYGTVLNDSLTIDGTQFAGMGLNFAFNNIANWNVFGLGGNDTFYVVTVVVSTMLVGDGSAPLVGFPVGVTPPDLTGGLAAGSFNDTFYIGWRGVAVPGSLTGIGAPLTVQGDEGLNAAYVDDSGDTIGQYFTLTPTAMMSTSMGVNGQIIYAGLQTLNISLGSGNDTLAVNDMSNPTVTTIDGGAGSNNAALRFSDSFAGTLTLTRFQTAALNVVNDFTGTLSSDGGFTTAIIGGSLTSTGIFNAGSIDTMTVGSDLAGLLNVTGLLNNLAINGGSPGKIVAGDINYITVLAGYGNKVLQVVEGGIERQIQAAPVAGGPLSASILFAFIYDSSAAGNPELAMRLTNNGSVIPHSFNVTLACFDSNAQFNLATLVASSATGLSNLAVFGDILFSANAAERAFLQLDASARSGVVLPFDNITGVSVSGMLPIGMIQVAGIEGISFGLLVNANGQRVNILGDLGAIGNPQVLWNLLGSHATLLSANDALLIAFNEAHSVQVFAQANSNPTLEFVATFSDQLNDGAPVTASFQIRGGKLPVITNVSIRGDGASIVTRYDVLNITSTGSLGDVTVGGKGGLGNITASSILGNINVTNGAITGTIQTTGIRINPVTDVAADVSANIGRFTYDKLGNISGVTVIYAKGGITRTGAIISRGDLICEVRTNAAFSGLIAAQGNIGTILPASNETFAVTTAGQLTRFGGINIGGNAAGQIIALENILGDITIKGSLSGQIAARGQAIAGLAESRVGILGNIRLGAKLSSAATILSGGMIGDSLGGTSLKAGSVKAGLIAADGDVVLAQGTVISAGHLFANALGTANGGVIDAIFTEGNYPLQFDSGGSLEGLAAIQSDLKNIRASNGGLTGTQP